MRKINFLKTVLCVATAMLVTSAFGQVQNPTYVAYDSTAAAPNDSDYVTVGKTIGYYAKPDPILHPNYVNPTWTLTAGFTWLWTNPIHASAAAVAPSSTTNNYATYAFATEGAYAIQAQEVASAAFGGCPGSKSRIWIHAVPTPTGTLSTTPDVADWTIVTPNVEYTKCSTTTSVETETVTVSFFEKVPFDVASYAFEVTEEIDLLDGLGNVVVNGAETVIENFDLASKVKNGDVTGDDATSLPSAAFAQVTPHNFAYTFATDALAVQQNAGNSYRTRYIYRVRRAVAAGATTVETNNDFISNISHKSDFISGTPVYYAFTNNVVTYTVNPAPVTGPIYHISNSLRY